jgi:hypothetical protein
MVLCRRYERHAAPICVEAWGMARWVSGAHLLSLGLVAALALLAAPRALAQDRAPGVFQPPPGCTGWLTVQSRGCRVSNHYRCEADAPGDQWRADFDQEGIFFVSRIDRETQWVESFDLFPTVRQTLDPNPPDPASFTELLATGTDTFEFGLSDDTGARSTVRGFDTLTGRSVTIDGITLQETQFEYAETALDGTPLRSAKGIEYIHPDWRMFLSGISEWQTPDGPVPVDGTPRQFIFPGEPGFFATEPIFDCDATMSLDWTDGTILPTGLRK